jgi:DNA polymerase-3 subunit gamma/tau
MTGTLMERYRAQAQVCEAEFLFGAISILTELDGKIRQASNGRLLVELGLMKIARLGQKKKIEDEEYFELPALEPRVAPAPVVAAAPAVAPAPAPAPAPTPQPVQPATPAPQPIPQPVVETPKVESPKVEQPTPQPAVRKSSIGLSLSAMLAEEEAPKQVEKSEETLQPVIDPNTEQKLRVAATAILAMVRIERPRFYPSFERMELVGNEIRISVPSHELHDEIMRNRTALLLQIARKASVEGALELVVSINEEIRAEKPIKLEDRVRYMAERCPRLGTLRTALDMEVE